MAPSGLLRKLTCGRWVQQYWAKSSQAYRYVPVKTFSDAYEQSKLGRGTTEALEVPYEKPQGFSGIDPLVRTRQAITFA